VANLEVVAAAEILIPARLRRTIDEYPRQFWVLFFGLFINSAGSNLIFPFFSLYFTRKLGYSMTQMGLIFTLYAVSSTISQVIGGELVDRVGRKPIMVLSMLLGGIATFGIGFASTVGLASSLGFMSGLTIFAGFTGSMFGPAGNAMIADLIVAEKRTQAFGLMRVVQNLGVAIGPAIGGFIAGTSYLLLFGIAAVSSFVFGLIILFFTKETRPPLDGTVTNPAVKRTASTSGLSYVLRDRAFVTFCGLYAVALLVWSQAGTTLPVFLNRTYGITEQWYGLLMSLNAAMVVILQFPITRFTNLFHRPLMMALGAALFAIGFGLYGFVRVLPLFFVAQAVWTLGEMIATPVSQAYVADVAPATMRGRYMGMYGLVFTFAFGIGPLVGGSIMDNLGGGYIWQAAILLGASAAVGFLLLERSKRRSEIRESRPEIQV
jgi:MFS family permease